MFRISSQSLLDQYYLNPWISERFSIDLNFTQHSLFRYSHISGTVNDIEISESENLNFEYFKNNAQTMASEFKNDICNEIGEDKYNYFIELISNYWIPAGKRDSKKIRQLEFTIKEYLKIFCKAKIRVLKDKSINANQVLTLQDLYQILEITRRLVGHYIQEWLSSSKHDFSSNEIYLFRGINLENYPRKNKRFIEFRFINSYSLSLSIAEKFSDTVKQPKVNAIFALNENLVDNRILFFSPFLPGCQDSQLEFGLIPDLNKLRVKNACKRNGHSDCLLEKY